MDKSPDVSFTSPLKPEDVTLLLHKELSHVLAGGFFARSPLLRPRPLAGRVGAEGFCIGHAQMFLANPGERELRLVIGLEREGSRIDGWWRLTLFQRAVLFLLLISIIVSIFDPQGEIVTTILSLICSLIVFGFLFRWAGASGERQLESQLKELLQRPVATALLHG